MADGFLLPPRGRPSADVRLTLYIGAASFRLAQLGPDMFILSKETRLPGTSGIISIQVDENERRKVATWEASDAPRRRISASYSPLA